MVRHMLTAQNSRPITLYSKPRGIFTVYFLLFIFLYFTMDGLYKILYIFLI